jgi:hypothetical protein
MISLLVNWNEKGGSVIGMWTTVLIATCEVGDDHYCPLYLWH